MGMAKCGAKRLCTGEILRVQPSFHFLQHWLATIVYYVIWEESWLHRLLLLVSPVGGGRGGEKTANKIYDSFNFHLQRQLLNISVIYYDTSYASRFHRVDVAGAELYGVLHLPGPKLDVL